MMRVMLAFAVMWSIAIPAMRTAVAQTCDGIQVDVGGADRRCLQPGSGQAFRDCPECPEMVAAPAGRFTMGAPPHEEVYNERDREVLVVGRAFACEF